MYRTKKAIPQVDKNLYLPLATALKTLERESVGRGIYVQVDVPLPILGKEGTSYFPGMASVPLTKAQAKRFIEDSLGSMTKAKEGQGVVPLIRIHLYHNCLFIGGHYTEDKQDA